MIDWKELSIKDITTGIFDGPHATPEPSSSGPYFLGIKNITEDGKIDLSDPRFINEKDFPNWTKRVLPKGNDIVFSYEATLHRYAIIPKNLKCCLGRRLALIRIDEGKANYKFVYYYFFSQIWKEEINNHIINGATVDRIPIIDFPKFKLKLPPLPIQQKIASILSAYDDLIENNNRRIALLEKMAENLYNEWFVRMRFPGYEKAKFVNGLPEGWEEKKLGGIVFMNMGQSPSSEFYNDKGEGLPFHQGVTNFNSRYPTHLMYCSDIKKVAEVGDILLSVRAPVGRINISDKKIIIGRGIAALRNKNNYQSFIYYLLKQVFHTEDIFGNGAVFNAISKNELEGIAITYPSNSLIIDFEKQSIPIDNEIKNLTLQNLLIRQSRDQLLPKLISGKLSVEQLLKADKKGLEEWNIAAEPLENYKKR